MERDKESAPRDAYWQQTDANDYALWADGQKQAIVNPDRNTGVILDAGDVPGHEFMVPDYVSVFTEAEGRLHTTRIDDVRNAEGAPDREARLLVESTAALDRQQRTPDQWVRSYARRASELLSLESAEVGLSDEANEARQQLAGVAIEPESDVKVRARLESARDLLSARDDQGARYDSALIFCEKAIATLDYEDARNVLAHAPAEEAMRRGALSPERADSHWTPEAAEASAPEVTADQSDAADDRRFQPSRSSGSSERAGERARDGDDFGRER